MGKRHQGYKNKSKNLGSTDFSSALNTCKKFGAHSHAAMACFSEHSHCCHSCRQALGFNAVIPTRFYAVFQPRNSDCSESSESDRFSILVTRAENCGKKIDDCGGANKWEWVSVNGSRTGLVSQRHKNLVGH